VSDGKRQALFIFEARKNKMCLTVQLAFQSLCATVLYMVCSVHISDYFSD